MKLRSCAVLIAIFLAGQYSALGDPPELSGIQPPRDLPGSLDVTAFAAASQPTVGAPRKTCALPSGASDAVEISLAGQQIGNSLSLKLTAGAGKIQSVRVYSEPSHTLLGIILDKSVTEAESVKWLSAGTAAVAKGAAQIVRSDLSEGSVTLVDGPAPPSTDIAIYTHLRAFFAVKGSGVQSEEHELKTRTQPHNFAFTYRNFRESDGELDPQVCCGTGTCQACTTCDGESFTCCQVSGSGSCTLCRGNSVSCGCCSDQCPPC